MADVLGNIKPGEKLSSNTIARRLDIPRRYAMKLCCDHENKNELRRVTPTEVGWMAQDSKSKIFSLP